MESSSLPGFAVSASFSGQQAVLGVRGDVDIATAPDLGAIVDAVIDRGHRFVVLDLAELDFMDAAGLRVIARAAHRLQPPDAGVTVRSPSARVRRLLDLTKVSSRISLEEAPADSEHLGPEQPAGAAAAPAATAADGPARQVRTAMPGSVDDDVVDGALRLVVALARATVGGADGVSVSLRRHGSLATVAASDQTISDMDIDQYATGEGPCVDASIEGRWFHVESLANELRWPAFIPQAQALGINAILSSPLQARDEPVGALNIYSRTTTAFTATDQQLAALFASEASALLSHAGARATDEHTAGRLQQALNARQAIACAQGVIMQRDGVDAGEAYATLRRRSVASGLPLRRHAELVAGHVGPETGSTAALTEEGGPDG